MAAASPAPTPPVDEDASPAAQARKTRTQKALKKARRKFGFVSGIGSSGVRTDAGQREDVGFWKGLKNAKRRVSQQVCASGDSGCFSATRRGVAQTLTKLGYGKETEDEYYKERKKRIVELQGRYERLTEYLAQYTDAARCESCARRAVMRVQHAAKTDSDCSASPNRALSHNHMQPCVPLRLRSQTR